MVLTQPFIAKKHQKKSQKKQQKVIIITHPNLAKKPLLTDHRNSDALKLRPRLSTAFKIGGKTFSTLSPSTVTLPHSTHKDLHSKRRLELNLYVD